MSIAFTKLGTTYKHSDILHFGALKGNTLEYIVEHYPEYLQWLVTHIRGFYLTHRLKDELEDTLRRLPPKEEVTRRNTKSYKKSSYYNYSNEDCSRELDDLYGVDYFH